MIRSKILVISHVSPFDKTSGQNLRVANMLVSLKERFEVHLILLGSEENPDTRYYDRLIVLPSAKRKRGWHYYIDALRYAVYFLRTKLKRSNFTLQKIEFTQSRIEKLVDWNEAYQFVLVEYFHAHHLTEIFHKAGIPTVCDTHNILWKTRREQLKRAVWPKWVKKAVLKGYKQYEMEKALPSFERLISINANEHAELELAFPGKVFFCPMGINLSDWPYKWEFAPERLSIAFYGGLSSIHNQKAAIFIAEQVFPLLKQRFPKLKYWIIGSNPSDQIKALEYQEGIHVTGFVEKPSDVLSQVTLAVTPWEGKYGFRSRIIETMAIGTPVVTTEDALDGMSFTEGSEVRFCDNEDVESWARTCLQLLNNPRQCLAQSKMARSKVESIFSKEQSYDRLTQELFDWASGGTD